MAGAAEISDDWLRAEVKLLKLVLEREDDDEMRVADNASLCTEASIEKHARLAVDCRVEVEETMN